MSEFNKYIEELQNKMQDSRLYIAVLDEVPDYIVPTLVAHTILNADEKFNADFHIEYRVWKYASFKKCVVKVNRKEYNKIIELPNVFQGYENKTLGGENCCAIVCPVPNDQLPNVLKFAKLWKPNAK